jgi:hypothetical protein
MARYTQFAAMQVPQLDPYLNIPQSYSQPQRNCAKSHGPSAETEVARIHFRPDPGVVIPPVEQRSNIETNRLRHMLHTAYRRASGYGYSPPARIPYVGIRSLAKPTNQDGDILSS